MLCYTIQYYTILYHTILCYNKVRLRPGSVAQPNIVSIIDTIAIIASVNRIAIIAIVNIIAIITPVCMSRTDVEYAQSTY